tara:strand:- start:550 stop:792 length:243 start_codon:yes stop_codon:yes gene_type:complete
MGKLKQHLMDTSSLQVTWVMTKYHEFLQMCMKDRSLPNTWSDAVAWIHDQQKNIGGTGWVSLLQIEQIMIDNTESLYEGD